MLSPSGTPSILAIASSSIGLYEHYNNLNINVADCNVNFLIPLYNSE
jgi:hypothetical protein